MSIGPNITRIAALLADPSRCLMLSALMDGRALSAGELSSAGGVTPQTASAHLAKMVENGLLVMETQGRHRYFRLAGPQVATVLEAMMDLAEAGNRNIVTGPRDAPLRSARVCYDHLAGEKGVALFNAMMDGALIDGDGTNVFLTKSGSAMLEAQGIDIAALRKRRRPLCRTCLDWSERRTHLSGSVGASLLDMMLSKHWARRVQNSRALDFSPEGERQFNAIVSAFRGPARA